MESIRKQLDERAELLLELNGKKRRLNIVKTDSLHSRIGRRLRKMAKLYEGIYGYYEDEYVVVDYIFQIIRQAIKEVENEK